VTLLSVVLPPSGHFGPGSRSLRLAADAWALTATSLAQTKDLRAPRGCLQMSFAAGIAFTVTRVQVIVFTTRPLGFLIVIVPLALPPFGPRRTEARDGSLVVGLRVSVLTRRG